MTIKEAVNERHSVRQYKNIPIENEKEKELRDFIEAIKNSHLPAVRHPGREPR